MDKNDPTNLANSLLLLRFIYKPFKIYLLLFIVFLSYTCIELILFIYEIKLINNAYLVIVFINYLNMWYNYMFY